MLAPEELKVLVKRFRQMAQERSIADLRAYGFRRPGEIIVLIQPALLTRTGAEEDQERRRGELLAYLRDKNFLKGEVLVGGGGVGGALLRACASAHTGFELMLAESEGDGLANALWREAPGRALVACWSSAHLALANFVDRSGLFTGEAIGRVTGGEVRVRWMGELVLATDMRELQASEGAFM